VVNLPPVAVDDTASVSEDAAAVTGNVLTDPLTGDADTAPDSDPLVVTAVDGDPATVGQLVPGDKGGSFVINADGSYTFMPAHSFDDLAPGETRITSVSYTVSDGNGGTATATVSVSVVGENDSPRVIDQDTPIAPQSGTDAQPIKPLDVSAVFLDADNGDRLTFSADGLPKGLSIDPKTGVITGTLDRHASVAGPHRVLITARDTHGGSAVVAFDWTISNIAPVAANDTVSGHAGEVVRGSVAANDSDADADRVSFRLLGDAGHGKVVMQADGTYVYRPDAGFQGKDRFVYEIIDEDGDVSRATVHVTVEPPLGSHNIDSLLAVDGPIAVDDGRRPVIDLGDFGEIEVTYPNNVFIHFVVTDEGFRLETQFGLGTSGEMVRYAIERAVGQDGENGGLFDALGDGMLGASGNSPLPEAGEVSGTDSDREASLEELPAGSADRQVGVLNGSAMEPVVPFTAQLRQSHERFDRHAEQWLKDLARVA
jgi:VCBS repeat-containing protein